MLAPAFAAGTANAAGTYVTYDGGLYYLPSGHTADATWANTTKTLVTVGGQLTDVKSAINVMNDGGNLDFYHGSGVFYNGYYNGTPEYTGNGNIASPPFTGWNVLLVHVIAGKTIRGSYCISICFSITPITVNVRQVNTVTT